MAIFQHGVAYGAAEAYTVENSLRFNQADSSYIKRTPASGGNQRTFTFSCWIKRGLIGDGSSADRMELWNYSAGTADSGAARGELQLRADNVLTPGLNPGGSSWSEARAVISMVDPSAWYHIVWAVDTTQSTDTNRSRLYINGVENTSFTNTSNWPVAEDFDTGFNQTNVQAFGRYESGSSHNLIYADFLLADFYLIDGIQLTPSAFAEENSDGQWVPKEYDVSVSGAYGTTGYHLDFSDATSTTTLGEDAAGSNDFTLYNFATTDQMNDSPSVGKNYCTLNPLSISTGTLTEGNLKYVGPGAWTMCRSTFAVSSGKWYWEVAVLNAPYGISYGDAYNTFGVVTVPRLSIPDSLYFPDDTITISDSGWYRNFGGSETDTGSRTSAGDVLGFALNLDDYEWSYYLNGSVVIEDQAINTSGNYSEGDFLMPERIAYDDSHGQMISNFGSDPTFAGNESSPATSEFFHAPPSGYKALNSGNLTASAITTPVDHYNTVLYAGTGAVSQDITTVGFQPNLIWLKSRDNSANYSVTDSVRGAHIGLSTSTDSAEVDDPYGVEAFLSNGFTVRENTLAQGYTNTGDMVGWCWKESATAGFDVVEWTGDDADPQTVDYYLGGSPAEMIIAKNRSAVFDWVVYHKSLPTPEDNPLILNSTEYDPSSLSGLGLFDNTALGSTSFLVAMDLNYDTEEHIAYCFRSIEGYCAIGKYTGNGSADGPFVYTGFLPAWLMVKSIDAAQPWAVYDSKRNDPAGNPLEKGLYPNSPEAEDDLSGRYKDFLSNGFKVRGTNGEQNADGDGYLYIAFAEQQFKYGIAK